MSKLKGYKVMDVTLDSPYYYYQDDEHIGDEDFYFFLTPYVCEHEGQIVPIVAKGRIYHSLFDDEVKPNCFWEPRPQYSNDICYQILKNGKVETINCTEDVPCINILTWERKKASDVAVETEELLKDNLKDFESHRHQMHDRGDLTEISLRLRERSIANLPDDRKKKVLSLLHEDTIRKLKELSQSGNNTKADRMDMAMTHLPDNSDDVVILASKDTRYRVRDMMDAIPNANMKNDIAATNHIMTGRGESGKIEWKLEDVPPKVPPMGPVSRFNKHLIEDAPQDPADFEDSDDYGLGGS